MSVICRLFNCPGLFGGIDRRTLSAKSPTVRLSQFARNAGPESAGIPSAPVRSAPGHDAHSRPESAAPRLAWSSVTTPSHTERDASCPPVDERNAPITAKLMMATAAILILIMIFMGLSRLAPLVCVGWKIFRRKRERDVLARVGAATHRDDDVLPSVEHVCHRRSALLRRHVYCADLFPGRLVVGSQHRASRTSWRRGDLRVAHDDQRLGDHQSDGAVLSCLGNVHSFKQRVIADHIRRVAMRNLPCQLTLVQIDG